MTEQMAIETAKKGCPEALEQIYLSNRSRVFNLARRYVPYREDAEDIVQETFLKAFNGIQAFNADEGGGFAPWINRICVHCAIDHLRRRRRQGGKMASLDALPQEPPSSDPSPEDIAIERGDSRRLENAVENLPPRQQVIFTLRYREHLDIRQIAVRLDCTPGNVRAQLFRSTSKLRGFLRTE